MEEDKNCKLLNVGESLMDSKCSQVGDFILNFILAAFTVLVVCQLLFNCFFTGIYVVNVSMQPNFNGAVAEDEPGGDFVYANTWVSPRYGDVVIVDRKFLGERGNIIKRVVAFGGDTVEIAEGVLYINDEIVDESGYIDPDRNTPETNNFARHVVREGHMFLLGDNRNKSTDSRDYGDFPMSSLVGVVQQWSITCKPFTSALYNFLNF